MRLKNLKFTLKIRIARCLETFIFFSMYFFVYISNRFIFYSYCLQNINTKVVEIDQHLQPLVK